MRKENLPACFRTSPNRWNVIALLILVLRMRTSCQLGLPRLTFKHMVFTYVFMLRHKKVDKKYPFHSYRLPQFQKCGHSPFHNYETPVKSKSYVSHWFYRGILQFTYEKVITACFYRDFLVSLSSTRFHDVHYIENSWRPQHSSESQLLTITYYHGEGFMDIHIWAYCTYETVKRSRRRASWQLSGADGMCYSLNCDYYPT